MARRRGPRRAGRRGRPRRPRLALYTRADAADRAAAPLRPRRPPPPCATARATTSSTPPRSRTSRCSRPRVARRRHRYGSSSTGSRSGRASTGASTSGRSAGASAGGPARCIRVPQQAFCFSRLHARRLGSRACAARVTVLEGLYAGPARRAAEPRGAARRLRRPPHPREAGARARARDRACAGAVPELRGEIFGDGPDRPEVLRLIAEPGSTARSRPRLRGRGRGAQRAATRALPRLPSRREGYGLVVVEAAALGMPSVVVRGPDNAATELVDDGENGAVADSASPTSSRPRSSACTRGPRAAESTAAWFGAMRAGSRSIGRSRSCSPRTDVSPRPNAGPVLGRVPPWVVRRTS